MGQVHMPRFCTYVHLCAHWGGEGSIRHSPLACLTIASWPFGLRGFRNPIKVDIPRACAFEGFPQIDSRSLYIPFAWVTDPSPRSDCADIPPPRRPSLFYDPFTFCFPSVVRVAIVSFIEDGFAEIGGNCERCYDCSCKFDAYFL